MKTLIPLATCSEYYNPKLLPWQHKAVNGWIAHVWSCLNDGGKWFYPAKKVTLIKREAAQAWEVTQ